MPTYDYRCDACGHELELFQSMSSSPKRKCPECGKLKLKRLIGTGGGLIFKGSGFYLTDYRSDSYKKAAEADKKPGDTADKSSSDSKSADSPKPSDPPKNKGKGGGKDGKKKAS